MLSRSSSTAGRAIRSASSSRSRPQEGWMVKALCARTGVGSPATTANSQDGSRSSARSTPKTSQMVPNSNGRKPLTTTTATLRSMVTRPAGAHPATDPATDRHDLKYARGIGRMSSNNGITATGRASRGEATWTHGHVLGFQPGPPGPRRSQRDELREQAGHATEAWLRPGRVGPGAGHVRRIPDEHGGHDPTRTVRPAPGDRPPGQVAAPGALAAADRALPGDRGEHPPQVTGPGGVTGQPDGVVADPAP